MGGEREKEKRSEEEIPRWRRQGARRREISREISRERDRECASARTREGSQDG